MNARTWAARFPGMIVLSHLPRTWADELPRAARSPGRSSALFIHPRWESEMPIDGYDVLFTYHDKESGVTLTVEVPKVGDGSPRLNLSPPGERDVSIPIDAEALSPAVSALVRAQAAVPPPNAA